MSNQNEFIISKKQNFATKAQKHKGFTNNKQLKRVKYYILCFL